MPRIAYGNLRNQGGPSIALRKMGDDVSVAASYNQFQYNNYPMGLDLRPGTDLHDRLVGEVISRCQESYDVMSSRRDNFRKIDEKLTAFIDIDESERQIKEKDKRKPVSIVIPLSYATLQTLLTYWVNTFSQQEVLFGYEGTGPEDSYGTILLEQIIKFQSAKMKHLLALHSMWRSSLAYGIGLITPIWTKKIGKKSVPKAIMGMNFMTGMSEPIGWEQNWVDTVMFEGNDLVPIDPYLWFPDPRVSAHRIQDSEFLGWGQPTNLMRLLIDEAQDETIFNCEYVRLMKQPTSRFLDEEDTKRDRLIDNGKSTTTTTNQVDLVNLYITLIPSEWELGPSQKPEKWLFTVAGDRILIRAQPLGLNHNMYPVAMCAPDFDGFSAAPLSAIETVYGCQELIDFLMNSHIANVRKALNDMFIVDPYMINLNDMKTPGPGKLIRMRRSAWGRGVKDAMMQFPVTDVTSQNIPDVVFINQLVQQVTGASDILQGVQRRSSERVTRAEIVGTQTAALSRIERGARVGATMAHDDLAYMMASHTQQFMSKDMVLKTTGRWQDTLAMEYGIMQTMTARPIDIQVDFDVLPQDAPMKGGEYIDAWQNIFQQIAQSPVLSTQFDTIRIFKHLARLMGAKDLANFMVPGVGMPMMNTQIVPDELLNQRVQQGRYIPVEQAA